LSQHQLASLLFFGNGVPKDTEAAVQWWRRAADLGEPLAMESLGVLYLKGMDVPKDEAQAAKLLRRASEKGRPTAGEHLRLLCARTPGLEACQKTPA
jgi:TPR repeat protein